MKRFKKLAVGEYLLMVKLLTTNRVVKAVSHNNLDFDGLASLAIMGYLFPEVQVCIDSNSVQSLEARCPGVFTHLRYLPKDSWSNKTAFVGVDVGDRRHAGLSDDANLIACLDNHQSDAGAARFIVSDSNSVCAALFRVARILHPEFISALGGYYSALTVMGILTDCGIVPPVEFDHISMLDGMTESDWGELMVALPMADRRLLRAFADAHFWKRTVCHPVEAVSPHLAIFMFEGGEVTDNDRLGMLADQAILECDSSEAVIVVGKLKSATRISIRLRNPDARLMNKLLAETCVSGSWGHRSEGKVGGGLAQSNLADIFDRLAEIIYFHAREVDA